MNKDSSVLISIIVPVYNAEKCIQLCIDSILNQTYDNFELLLIDDGSSDNSKFYIKKFKDSRIHYLYKNNGGVSSARNAGLKIAQGKYVMFVDSDDQLPRNALENMVKVALEYNSDLVSGGYKVIAKKNRETDICNKRVEGKTLSDIGDFKELYKKGFFTSPWAKLFKNDKSILFDESMNYGEDCLYNINYLSKHNKVICILDTIVYFYIDINDFSLSKVNDKNIKCMINKKYSALKDTYRIFFMDEKIEGFLAEKYYEELLSKLISSEKTIKLIKESYVLAFNKNITKKRFAFDLLLCMRYKFKLLLRTILRYIK